MQKKNSIVGLHVRLHESLDDIFTVVQKLELPIVQSFLLKENGSYVQLSDDIITQFVHKKEKLNFSYFVHAAYWSNVSKKNSKEFLSLCKETQIAKDLHSNGIVIHIGATRAHLQKWDQARFVAEAVNELLHKISDITIILENAPHAGRNFGGDMTDFRLLFDLIEDHNRVRFCLDTAHAFVYGYELTNPVKYQDFIQAISDNIGSDKIGLLHLNDAAEKCGSYIDKHGIAGQGYLGRSVLEKIMQESLFAGVATILELPSTCGLQQEEIILKQVRQW